MVSQNTVKYGLIAALVNVVIAIILYALGPGALAGGIWSGLIFLAVNLVVTIVVLSVLGSKIRQDEGGFITFKKMFINLFLVVLIMVIGGGLFGYLLYGVVDTQWMLDAKEMTIANMYEYKDNMPEAAFEAQLERIEEQFSQSFGNTLKQLGGSILGWTIFSLILAAILKKKQEDFAG